jgi:hypothetical protein
VSIENGATITIGSGTGDTSSITVGSGGSFSANGATVSVTGNSSITDSGTISCDTATFEVIDGSTVNNAGTVNETSSTLLGKAAQINVLGGGLFDMNYNATVDVRDSDILVNSGELGVLDGYVGLTQNALLESNSPTDGIYVQYKGSIVAANDSEIIANSLLNVFHSTVGVNNNSSLITSGYSNLYVWGLEITSSNLLLSNNAELSFLDSNIDNCNELLVFPNGNGSPVSYSQNNTPFSGIDFGYYLNHDILGLNNASYNPLDFSTYDPGDLLDIDDITDPIIDGSALGLNNIDDSFDIDMDFDDVYDDIGVPPIEYA